MQGPNLYGINVAFFYLESQFFVLFFKKENIVAKISRLVIIKRLCPHCLKNHNEFFDFLKTLNFQPYAEKCFHRRHKKNTTKKYAYMLLFGFIEKLVEYGDTLPFYPDNIAG